jgi:hypothetical protein
MLASRIMHRRTTVNADEDALATLEAEARRRGVSLTAMLAEAVDEKARRIRADRRPSIGVARSTDGSGAAQLTGEPIAHPPA